MVRVALTGNIGMGKSYVLSVFRSLGAVTIESDRIVGMLLREKDVINRIRALLGDEVISTDGTLDKKAVAERVFLHPSQRKGLEEIIHPLVFDKIEDFIRNVKQRDCVVIVEVPLLFEGGYEGGYEKTITVFTSQKTALERLLGSGFSRDEALRRMRTQLPISVKKRRSDYTIDNNGTREQTREQAERVYRELLSGMKRQ